ncbi:HD family phosphohydrolase [Opitutus terrae]|uniref:Metal dependent phosphohydrolase n=1 Tax=Opitutus terrae (strain DSM 11246 / JCM 15787 / PB90-1) TaxID=452637 RepID=B1ZT16_OPITP|nr:HDIG domain-containing metalloprotein [Opitutus terrae]ACB75805.1 metal dependent phosphohydrolase [Opitutus terrae PB90-1]
MSVRDQFKLLVGGLNARRTHPPSSQAQSAFSEFLDRSRFVSALIFLFTVATILLISSAGITTTMLPVMPNQVATVRVTASGSFSFESAERTRVAREQVRDRVPPVYRLDAEPLQRFEAAALDLLSQLELFDQRKHPTSPGGFNLGTATPEERQELATIVEAFNTRGPYSANLDDVAAVVNAGDAKTRAALFENGFAALRDLYAQGVQDGTLAGSVPGGITVFQIARPDGQVTPRPVQTLEQALTFLRVNLAAEGLSRSASLALFRLFRNGLVANVVFDREATQQREEAAVAQVPPITIGVVRGQTIIEPGDRVTPEQYEMLMAHRKYVREHTDTQLDENLTLFGRVLLVLAMVLASIIYIRIEDPETLLSNVRLGLLALVVIFNLAVVRAVYSFGGADFFVRDGSWASTLPYVAPTVIAPLLLAILIDAGSAIFMALLISIFTGVIYGNRLDLLVLTFLSSLVAIFFCRDARQRGKVVRAACAGGLTVAAFATLIGIADQTPWETISRQIVAGLITGLVTGVIVVGLLPVLESLFKRTTDITLLELTDYNHPLLRRMQLEAPGTYHHSLIVAQLAEYAANAIGANPLLARVCSLFHDVGKTAHAAFFSENQRDGVNPHQHEDPAVSARIIKQHVADGAELAHKHHLPNAVIDVIQQHHGTTLVRYFYQRALDRSRAPFPAKPTANDAAKPQSAIPFPSAAPAAIDEASFRYDGPKPHTKESAIISLADAVEAASRSLRQTTPAQLSELIDRIVGERIEDGQLDEAPLSLVEITRIKNSFQFTLLNMLHGRVSYPPVAETPPSAQAKA